ncbi:MAG: AhpC/TSA family protein [Oleispira sp.]|nr:AhpC/TSA family protein [Oleispira sp.]MBL4881233.1 AhpC/TSA family protein [Oleispira sp.]
MLIKSLFIGIYPVIAIGLLISPFVGLGSPTWLMALAIIAALPFPLFLGNLFRYQTARTSENLNALYAIPALALILSVIGILVTGLESAEYLINVMTITSAITGNLLYVFWYSRFGREDNSLLKVGGRLPEFSLKDAAGNSITSQEIGSQASLIMFYRGNWCPLCMAQIKEVAEQYRELEKRGIKIYMVSPQSEGHTGDLAKRFDVNMNFLIDEDNKAASMLQIVAKNGLPMGLQVLGYDSDTVMPTVVMTNSEGEIIFADLTDNYRVRPEPGDFLRVFDGQQAGA